MNGEESKHGLTDEALLAWIKIVGLFAGGILLLVGSAYWFLAMWFPDQAPESVRQWQVWFDKKTAWFGFRQFIGVAFAFFSWVIFNFLGEILAELKAIRKELENSRKER
jgi:hypothetical protein